MTTLPFVATLDGLDGLDLDRDGHMLLVGPDHQQRIEVIRFLAQRAHGCGVVPIIVTDAPRAYEDLPAMTVATVRALRARIALLGSQLMVARSQPPQRRIRTLLLLDRPRVLAPHGRADTGDREWLRSRLNCLVESGDELGLHVVLACNQPVTALWGCLATTMRTRAGLKVIMSPRRVPGAIRSLTLSRSMHAPYVGDDDPAMVLWERYGQDPRIGRLATQRIRVAPVMPQLDTTEAS